MRKQQSVLRWICVREGQGVSVETGFPAHLLKETVISFIYLIFSFNVRWQRELQSQEVQKVRRSANMVNRAKPKSKTRKIKTTIKILDRKWYFTVSKCLKSASIGCVGHWNQVGWYLQDDSKYIRWQLLSMAVMFVEYDAWQLEFGVISSITWLRTLVVNLLWPSVAMD